MIGSRVADWRSNSTYLSSSGVLAAACVLSLVGAWAFPLNYAGKTPQIHWMVDLSKLGYLLLPLLVAQVLARLTQKERTTTVRYWLLFSGLISAIAIPQFFTGWPRPQDIPGLPGHYHATLFFGHHLSTASILIFPLFISASLAASGALSKELKSRFDLKPTTLAFIAGLISTALFLSWSRTLWIALPIGLGIWAFRYVNRAKAMGVVLTSLLVAITAFTQVPQLRSRMTSALGTSDRFELWRANLSFFQARPWTGIGWRKAEGMTASYFKTIYDGDVSSRFVGHAHNNFLEMLGGTGLLGTLAWVGWTLLVFQMSLRLAKRRDEWGEIGWGFFCAWVVFQINGLTQVNFWEGKVLHQVMWGVSMLIFASTLPKEERAKP